MLLLKIKFLSKVVKTDSCWLWRGSINKTTEYGNFSMYGRSVVAHRAAWIIFKGAIPVGMQVLHKCDVRYCVKPSHLFLGTPDDNVKDCVNKNRMHSGEHHPKHKLTWKQVDEIRQSKVCDFRLASIIARKYKVTPQTIWSILQYKTWRKR